MLAAAAVCPHPPLLVPEVARSTTAPIDELRAACTTAVGELLAAAPDVVVCVGDGPDLRRYDESDGGTLRGYGVDVRAGGNGSDDLPSALTLGAWLLDRAGWSGPRRYIAMPRETTAEQCRDLGETTVSADLAVGVLAMGDGSAKRGEHAPGYLDDRAEPFDAAVAKALAGPDPTWLADHVAPVACAELWVAGRQAWQFLAGAASTPGGRLAAHLHYDAAPFGVGYFVATWTPDAAGT